MEGFGYLAGCCDFTRSKGADQLEEDIAELMATPPTQKCGSIVSLVSLAFLSYERYCTMMAHTEANDTNYAKISAGIVLSWGYSVVWTVPPLFGWSNYGPEGPSTTCSVNWAAHDANSASYILCLFLFCLVIPFSVIIYSYGRLLQAIKQVARINTALSHRQEQQVLQMVVVMVICYLVCWLPYSVVALLASFGRPGLVTSVLKIVPSLLAKCSTAINRIIYIFMNKQFYRCFLTLLQMTGLRKKTPRLMEEEYLSLIEEVIYWLTQPKVKKDPTARALATRSREVLDLGDLAQILEPISPPDISHLAEEE
ncbi:pinopsin-like [Paramormyrops kingsleyae]|uniref:pinopsin-like n=1 Tax=Paramormyrops kingsleyae TaxID=1676925 RepID=UPI003B96A507